jgi:hypothetical protein
MIQCFYHKAETVTFSLKLWYLSPKQQSIKSAEVVFVGRIIPQRGCVQILPYEANLLHSIKVITAVDVSKIKVNFILCYWACVLYATHMLNVVPSSRNHGSIQEARKYICMNKSCKCKIYQNPERSRAGKSFKGVCPYCL